MCENHLSSRFVLCENSCSFLVEINVEVDENELAVSVRIGENSCRFSSWQGLDNLASRSSYRHHIDTFIDIGQVLSVAVRIDHEDVGRVLGCGFAPGAAFFCVATDGKVSVIQGSYICNFYVELFCCVLELDIRPKSQRVLLHGSTSYRELSLFKHF